VNVPHLLLPPSPTAPVLPSTLLGLPSFGFMVAALRSVCRPSLDFAHRSSHVTLLPGFNNTALPGSAKPLPLGSATLPHTLRATVEQFAMSARCLHALLLGPAATAMRLRLFSTSHYNSL